MIPRVKTKEEQDDPLRALQDAAAGRERLKIMSHHRLASSTTPAGIGGGMSRGVRESGGGRA
ncbi:hypothetical protein E2C01_079820 [Portunus trituberculatus]|uniref:Uncharacterized protein n=1 Tax=Portunus trituberculatus TaxID=210409 RepID=A0A5B7IHV8_PORTR|nr:hypothetical protein [Portunus trituberculatus]